MRGLLIDLGRPGKYHERNLKWARQYGGMVYATLLHQQFIFLYSPTAIATALSREVGATKDNTYEYLKNLAGSNAHNLISMPTDHPQYKVVRRAVATAFAQKNIRNAFTVVRRLALRLGELLAAAGPDGTVDVYEYAMRETIDIIGEWGFQLELGTLEGHNTLQESFNLMDTMRDFGRLLVAMFTKPLWQLRFWDKTVIEWKRQCMLMSLCTHNLLQRCKARYPSGQPAEDDQSMLAALLRVRDPLTGEPLREQELESHIAMLFFAGFETTGATIAYALYLLSAHPEADGKVAAELDAAGLLLTPQRTHPREMQYDDLAALPYLQAVVKETLRLYPSAPAVRRVVKDRDIIVDGTRIPAGVPVVCSIYAVQRAYWPDGDAFKPERWLEEGTTPALWNPSDDTAPAPTATAPPSLGGGAAAGRVPGAAEASSKRLIGDVGPKRYLPFADGSPRDCVGQPLAKMSVPTTLALLLARYNFRLAPGFDPDSLAMQGITIRPAAGIRMHCVPRVGSAAVPMPA